MLCVPRMDGQPMISANTPYYYHPNHIHNEYFYGLSVEMSVTYIVRLSRYIVTR